MISNAQLVPESSIDSIETGMRHRTAERVAKQTGSLVVAISQRRNVITLYQREFTLYTKRYRRYFNKGESSYPNVRKI